MFGSSNPDLGELFVGDMFGSSNPDLGELFVGDALKCV
jgi:hypothetical protein